MADDGGYEVVGPAATGAAAIPAFPEAVAKGTVPPPPAAAPPPPPPPPPPKPAPVPKPEPEAVTPKKDDTSVVEGKSIAPTAMESVIGDAEEGRAAFQRPNTCDMVQLALIWFLLVLVIAVSIPVLLAATGTSRIESITNRLFKV